MSLADRLRRRRPLYLAFLLACAMSALCVPITMQWLDHVMRSRGGEGFAVAPGLAFLQAQVGLPWWAQVWVIAIVYVLAVAALLLVFEVLGRGLDVPDASAASLSWSVRGWLPALVALAVFVGFSAASAALVEWMGFGERDLGWGKPLLQLVALVPYFFIWNADFLRTPRPSLRALRPRWPGVLAVLVPAAGVVAAGIASDKLEILGLPAGLVVAFFVVGFFFEIGWRWLWLNRSGQVLAAARNAFRPRLFLPGLMLEIRGLLAVMLPLLVLAPILWLLTQVVPQLVGDASWSSAMEGLWIVKWSRFAIAWWWALLMLVVGGVFALWTAWYRPLAAGRLTQLLGFVRDDDG